MFNNLKMFNMKNLMFLIIAVSFMLGSCKQVDEIVRNQNNELGDIYATKDGMGSQRLFEPRYSLNNDTIYFDVPYFYPVDSDNETDLARIILRSTVPSDAIVTPALGNVMDVSKPFELKIKSGSGQVRSYVVVFKKVGDLSVKSATVTLTNGEEIDAIVNGQEIIFFIVPGTNISNAVLSYEINKHSRASITNQSVIDLSQDRSFQVTGVDGVVKNYTIKVQEPVKLNYGVGINRRLWLKSSSELGQAGGLDVSMALSGNYLVAVIRSNPAVYRVYDRQTGAYVQNMVNPIVGNSFMIKNDTVGNLLTSSYSARNARFLMYKYTSPTDANPVKLIDWVNNTSTTVATDGGVGRRVHVYGNLNANAVIMATIGNSKSIYRWRVSNGTLVNNTPELIEYQNVLGASGHMGFYPEAQPISGEANANYFINYASDLALVNGTTQQKIVGFSLTPSVVGTTRTGIGFAKFNNANFLAVVKYQANTVTRARLGLFDVTETSKIALPFTDPRYATFSMYESEDFTSISNPNGTSDICIGFSPDKERMQVYMLLTNGGIMAHEFTKYAP